MKVTRFNILAAGIAALAMGAIPALSMAATYAYVNTSGEVMTTEAVTPETAIVTAPSIQMHSGVIVVDSSADADLKGDRVSGI